MKRILKIFVLFLLAHAWLSAQSIKVDSLQSLLAKELVDSIKIRYLYNLMFETQSEDPEKTINYGNQAVLLSDESGYDLYLTRIHIAFATAYSKLKDPLAEQHYKSAIELAQSQKDLYVAYSNYGRFLRPRDLDSSAFYFGKCLEVIEKNNINQEIIMAYNNVAISNAMLGNMEYVDSLLMLAIDKIDLTDRVSDKIDLYYTLVVFNNNTKNFDAASKFADLGYKLATENHIISEQVGFLNFNALTARASNDSIRAMELWELAAQIIDENNIVETYSGDIYSEILKVYVDGGLYEKAEVLNRKFAKLADELDDPLFIMVSELKQCRIEFLKDSTFNIQKALDEAELLLGGVQISPKIVEIYDDFAELYYRSKNYLKSLKYTDMIFDLSSKMEIPEYITSSYNLYSANYEALGNYKNALKYSKLYYENKLDKLNALMDERIIETRTRLQADLKEKENEILTARNSEVLIRNRNLIIASTGILIFSGLLAWLFFQNRQAKVKIEQQNQQLAVLNNTKDKLFAIISHDLRSEISAFQNLNNIYGYHLEQGNTERLKELVRQVDQSATSVNALMNNLLVWSASQLDGINLNAKQLNVVQESLQMLSIFEKYAAIKKIDISIDIDENIDVYADENSFQLILRNIVSNAIKFTPEGGEIAIRAIKNEEHVTISVEDSGLGISQEKLQTIFSENKTHSSKGTNGERGSGLGLTLVQEFLERNGGKFEIESNLNKGTKVKFSLPLFTL